VAAFATMINEGWYERHLRSVGLICRRRRQSLVAAIRHRLPSCRVDGATAGLHLPLMLPLGTDTTRVVREAGALGLPLVDLDHCRLRPSARREPGLVLGFGNLHSGHEDAATARLAEALRRSGLP
jgi:GntR family transcriptional regulator/MocR family aminotransferase